MSVAEQPAAVDAGRRAAADLVAALPQAPAVWCSGLRKRYGRQQAVADVSFEVARGEVVGLLGQRELHLQLSEVSPEAEARLAATGKVERAGDAYTLALSADDDGTAVPDLVRDLADLGVRVHAVEPARITLEERLLGILRDGAAARSGDARCRPPGPS